MSAAAIPTRAMLEQAAEWQALLLSGEASEADRQACLCWRAGHPGHEAAFQHMQAVLGQFEPLADPARLPERQVFDAEIRRTARHRTRRTLALGVSGLLLGLGGLFVSQVSTVSLSYVMADYRSPPGETRQVDLPDGSYIVLGGGSAANVDFEHGQRRVVLRRGELLAQVAPDPQRAFIVDTPLGSAQALGTRYTVRLTDDERVDVAVLESLVRVCDTQGTACLQAGAGQGVLLDAAGPHGPQPIDPLAESAWLSQRLIVENMPLAQVLDLLKRQYRGVLWFDEQALAGINVSGVLTLNDVPGALDMLAQHLPLRVKRELPFVTRIVPIRE